MIRSNRPVKIHIGAGSQRIEGWWNLDIRPLSGVDVVADVTQGLGFRRADAVYAEHFLEHLQPDQALAFLREVRGILSPGGRLRLSTPNLEWVWSSHYVIDAQEERKRDLALIINRAFYGWEHKFLWNVQLLSEALRVSGFGGLIWHRYGESESPYFQGIERHETYQDHDEMPHVIIVEGGLIDPDPKGYARLEATIRQEFLEHLEGY